MSRAFVVVPEGDVAYIMQVCPDALMSASGFCPCALYCDCLHGDDGPLWMDRGYWPSVQAAQQRAQLLDAQFWSDVERSKLARERSRERELRAMSAKRALLDGVDDVVF